MVWVPGGGSGGRGRRRGSSAWCRCARAGLVRDHHRRVPVPRARWSRQLELADRRHGRALAAAAHVGQRVINWPFYYVLVAILVLQLLMTWWIRRTKFGMGLIAIREDETKAATIGINLPVQKMARSWRARCSSAWRARLRLLPDVHRPARDVRDPAQRPDHPDATGRRQGHAVGSGVGGVPDRAAQRDREQQPRHPRRRQRPAVPVRRAC